MATLASAAPAATTSAASSAGRPQLRLDTGDDEENRIWAAYNDCLVAKGVKVLAESEGARRIDQSGEPKAAYVACQGKLPLPPPELDEALNPDYAAQWNDNVACLRAHGLKVHVTGPGSWTYDSADVVVPGNESQIQHDCLIETFGNAGTK
ncbi:hypothetical protein GCM10009828_088160 [Actinoplanes couchii]|uniref:PASTA domain-containing protein n=1 Tax=Actinoplanes couchii TaxID=403638 RepID=A0ABQ3XTB7_9ACTN|nr:hypothetical protein Aco03nite_101170 [Actinoplanes couchii]